MVLRRHLLLCAVAGLLAGCEGTCPTGCRTDLVIGQDRHAMVRPALQQAAADFLAPPAAVAAPRLPATPDTSAAARAPFTLDADILGPDSTTPHRLAQSRFIGVRPSATLPLGRGWAVTGSATAGYGHARHHLPAGIGVLTDPTTIRFSGVSLSPELLVSRQVNLSSGLQLSAGIGAGRQISWTRTKVQSALLDVRSRSRSSVPYAVATASVGHDTWPGTVVAEARLHEQSGLQLRAELRMGLAD